MESSRAYQPACCIVKPPMPAYWTRRCARSCPGAPHHPWLASVRPTGSRDPRRVSTSHPRSPHSLEAAFERTQQALAVVAAGIRITAARHGERIFRRNHHFMAVTGNESADDLLGASLGIHFICGIHVVAAHIAKLAVHLFGIRLGRTPVGVAERHGAQTEFGNAQPGATE